MTVTQGSQVQSVRIHRVSLLSLPPQTVYSLAPSRSILKASSRVDGFKVPPERMFNLSLGRRCLSSLQLFQEGVKFELGKFRLVVEETLVFFTLCPYLLVLFFFQLLLYGVGNKDHLHFKVFFILFSIFGRCCHINKSLFSEKAMDSCRFIPISDSICI